LSRGKFKVEEPTLHALFFSLPPNRRELRFSIENPNPVAVRRRQPASSAHKILCLSITIMPNSQYTLQTRLGSYASFLVVALLVAYLITTILGLADLSDKDDPIQDPYFTTMEILIILMMVPILVALDAYRTLLGSTACSWLGNLAFIFLVISTAITSSVHAAVLMANRSKALQQANPEFYDYLFSFQWPSVVYALDILAWDWFFALSLLFFGFAVQVGLQLRRLERALQVLFLGGGALSLLGLIAVPMDNIQVRMIGIFGYAVVTIPLFSVLGVYIRKADSTSPLGPEEPSEIKDKEDNQDHSHSSHDPTLEVP